MKPLRLKIQEQAEIKKTPQQVIEKDYALSYVLAGIANHPLLSRTLIFKGGTALKKIYFGDYRFSEDLDFSVLSAPKGAELEQALFEAIEISRRLLHAYGAFDIQLKRNPEKAPHPQGQEAFNLYVKFPWHPTALCRIKIEVTHDEPVLLSPVLKLILHEYGEEITGAVACYPIEEVIAEKLRALLQTHQKLVLRGWNRPRARDYYDLWSVLKKYGDTLAPESVVKTLNQKCQHRHVVYQSIEDFFTPELVAEAKLHWQPTLRMLVVDLPECEEVLKETKGLITNLFESAS